ncbi:phosphoadenosine phosphosulfate reductase [Methanococcus voltae]|uniref:Phosphoadenosine phosphosulfate reductase n=1 Tax=Methanococcus voltae TaxID=2188 RepID=A0A8J7URA2_METVO|nr:phosphoadenosine phosphosulfate reductase family protein [Methanococcus voltae]MBP2201583.1 phosphoadenosine phosphosulfate reductase [Methanococcus voltae]
MKTVLGKIHLRWCETCNVPVLDKECSKCGNKTFEVKVTPPADARPAFENDITLINETLHNQFGITENIFENKVALVNKVPGTEYMQEIILDGQVVGILNYNEKSCQWKVIPTIEGARRFIETVNKKIIVIKHDVPPYILKGASILRPGLAYASPDIKTDDDVIILVENEELISKYGDVNGVYTDLLEKTPLEIDASKMDILGVGRARMDYKEMIDAQKGMIAKVRKSEEPRPANTNPVTSDFKTMVEANKTPMDKFETQAVGFMRNTAEKINLPPTVAYSGGKDSLVVYLLARNAFNNDPEIEKSQASYEILFNDTGIEFDETLENIDTMEKHYGKEILRTKSSDFWELVKTYGPPSRDNRWCSEECKLRPLGDLIDAKYSKGCLTFVGLRKYESINRSKKPRIWQSPNIKKQTLAAPILEWTAMHVWVYILRNEAPYNVLYEQNFDRVGCFMCPAMETGEIELIKRNYAELWNKWESFLKQWAEENNYDDEWVKKGWKLKYPKDGKKRDNSDYTN